MNSTAGLVEVPRLQFASWIWFSFGRHNSKPPGLSLTVPNDPAGHGCSTIDSRMAEFTRLFASLKPISPLQTDPMVRTTPPH